MSKTNSRLNNKVLNISFEHLRHLRQGDLLCEKIGNYAGDFLSAWEDFYNKIDKSANDIACVIAFLEELEEEELKSIHFDAVGHDIYISAPKNIAIKLEKILFGDYKK